MSEHVPINQNFNEDFRTLCGETGAPSFFGNFAGKGIEIRTQNIKDAILDQLRDYPVHIGSAYILTDTDILKVMKRRDVSMIVQKTARLSKELHDRYAHLGCTVSRKSISPRLAHCVPRNPRYVDIGIPDGVRWYGNINEDKVLGSIPVGHHKLLISGRMTKNRSKVIFHEASLGSYNFSMNAPNSFESWITIKDPVAVAHMVEMWVDFYSVSERLSTRRVGMTPDLTFADKPAPYMKLKCTKCNSLVQTFPLTEANEFHCPKCLRYM